MALCAVAWLADDRRRSLSSAFRHLPPNSTRTGNAIEGRISAQLSTDTVSALRKVLDYRSKITLKIQELTPSVNVIICFDYTNDRLPTHTSELCQKFIIMSTVEKRKK